MLQVGTVAAEHKMRKNSKQHRCRQAETEAEKCWHANMVMLKHKTSTHPFYLTLFCLEAQYSEVRSRFYRKWTKTKTICHCRVFMNHATTVIWKSHHQHVTLSSPFFRQKNVPHFICMWQLGPRDGLRNMSMTTLTCICIVEPMWWFTLSQSKPNTPERNYCTERVTPETHHFLHHHSPLLTVIWLSEVCMVPNWSVSSTEM